ncbi:hypothetical protein Bpfe_025790 [Biomphalaria pfeifferi]|uniref:Uncharacterized protein n=1 Tax=Biomphalaria pfeifferi TaxID=112525 RepID=A0AAD8B174_BIOPF|nr:hypothetical protein Bpfe_025790 [Biomphalaria pfeifferi]
MYFAPKRPSRQNGGAKTASPKRPASNSHKILECLGIAPLDVDLFTLSAKAGSTHADVVSVTVHSLVQIFAHISSRRNNVPDDVPV